MEATALLCSCNVSVAVGVFFLLVRAAPFFPTLILSLTVCISICACVCVCMRA